jgi:mRNA-degrading endonuclease HigB of HigAB toxin-antitoxin module
MIRKIASRWMWMAVAVLALVPLARAQAQIVGDWQGVASVQGADYHVIVHITAASDGSYAATLDSPELGATGVAMSGVTFKDGKFSMNVDAYHGVYTGTLSSDGTKISGVFAGDQETPIEFTRVAATAAPASAAAAAPAGAASIAGDWHGALNTGGKTLRVVLHVVAAKDGTMTGTLDSIDQGLSGIPVNNMTVKDSKLTFAVDALPVHASYEGTVKPGGSGIDGAWTQGQPLTLNFTPGAAVAASKPATPSDIDGTWAGTLDLNGNTLHILLKVTNTADGLTAQLQSPDQSPIWLSANSVTRANGTLTASFTAMQAEFSGKIAADLGSIEGTFSQGGGSMPLVLKRAQ